MQNQAMNSDFAILYRTNAQSRSFEESLRRLNIPYRIYGGVSFYQRKEIKDVLGYYRLTINSKDDESLKRIINYPARGIGQSTMDKIGVAAAEHDISLFTVISNLKDFNLGINSGITTKINDFVMQIKSYAVVLPYKDAYELANHIAVHSGVVRELYSDKTPEGVSRYENIQELLNGIKDFVEQERTPQEDELNEVIKSTFVSPEGDLFQEQEKDNSLKTLDEFMQEITLLTDVDKDKDDEKNADKVSLMTVHAAKGLEFKYVYVVGLEENLFPSQLSLNSRSDLEEERRLFYVAVTRAEKQATLSFATTRYRFGNLIYCEPSRFIDEIDDKFVDYPEEPQASSFNDNFFEKFRKSYDGPGKESNTSGTGKPINFNPQGKKLINIKSHSISSAAPVDLGVNKSLQIGDSVEHEKFGRGVILGLEGAWPETKALIDFEGTGNKNLLLKFARLNKA